MTLWGWESSATLKRRGHEGDTKVGPLTRCGCPHPHLHSPVRPQRTLDSPAVEVEDAEPQGGISLHRLLGLHRGRRATPGRAGVLRGAGWGDSPGEPAQGMGQGRGARLLWHRG